MSAKEEKNNSSGEGEDKRIMIQTIFKSGLTRMGEYHGKLEHLMCPQCGNKDIETLKQHLVKVPRQLKPWTVYCQQRDDYPKSMVDGYTCFDKFLTYYCGEQLVFKPFIKRVVNKNI